MELKKVTLANLADCTAQEVFDWVTSNLLKQGKKSVIFKREDMMPYCRYRGIENTKCAGGWVIADEEYNKNFEEIFWGSLVFQGKIPSAHYDLICKLQYIHDGNEPCQWAEEFGKLAEYKGLNGDKL